MKKLPKHAPGKLPSLKEAPTIVLQNQAAFMAWMEQGVNQIVRKFLELIGR